MAVKAQSKQRFIRMSHRKLRRIANEVRGKSVPDAVYMLRFMPYTAATVVLKNLRAAVANAEQQFGQLADPNQMFVSAIMVDEAPVYRRFKPRAQGRVYRIEKATAHLMVEVATRA